MGSEEEDPSWKELAYQFTQDTTLHGIRFITLPTVFQTRRVVWFVLVTTALTVFVILNVINVVNFLNYPKSVNVEVTYQPRLEFPAVTVCNFNRFRMSGVSKQGLFDTFWEYYNDYGTMEEGECTEYFDYAAGLCIMSEEEKNNLLVDQDNVIDRTYKGISEIACERMCTTMYDLTCSGVFYTRDEKLCELTSAVFEPWNYPAEPESEPCGPGNIEYFRRKRCTRPAVMTCNYEGWYMDNDYSNCKLDNSTETDEKWLPVIASLQHPSADHTMGTASGSYTHMLVTDKRSGYRAVMNTPFLTFNNTCLELHYSFMGSVNSTLHIKSLSENQHVKWLANISRTLDNQDIEGTPSWSRVFLSMPHGVHMLVIEGHRPSLESGQSGIAIDDVTLAQCDQFYANCLRSPTGDGFMGNISISQSGKQCASWAEVGGGYEDWMMPDGSLLAAGNTCRHPAPYLLSTPGCFVDASTMEYESCQIEYCECSEEMFRCADGMCIPKIYVCNGNRDCGDASDETSTNCPSQDVMDCHFNSEYACGYMDFGVTSLVWTRTNGLEVPDDGVAPVSDNTDSILGYFMLANAQSGTEGDVVILESQFFDLPKDYCVTFDLFLHFSESSTENSFRVYTVMEDYRYALPWTLHEYTTWEHSGWTTQHLQLVDGRYQMKFAYTMGFPYTCAAAIDNVLVQPCYMNTETHTILNDNLAAFGSQNDEDGIPKQFSCNYTGSDLCGLRFISTNSRGTWDTVPAEFFHDIRVDQIWRDSGVVPMCKSYFASHGIIESPSYPSNYTNGFSGCVAHIHAPAETETRIRFHVFDVNGKNTCVRDYMKITTNPSGSGGVDLCNANWDNAQIFNITAEDIYVFFHSDDTLTAIGFRAMFEVVPKADLDYMMVVTYDGHMSLTQYTATLHSSVMNNNDTVCLSIDYYFATEFYLKTFGSTEELYFQATTASETWNRLRQTLPSGHYQFAFVTSFSGSQSGFHGAIDNLLLEDGDCTTLHSSGSVTCDFSDIQMCGYLDVTVGLIQWVRAREWNSRDVNFVMWASFREHSRDITLKLLSPEVTINRTQCLSFRYMCITARSNVDLWITTEPAFSSLTIFKCNEQWQKGLVNLPNGTYRVVFGGRAEEADLFLDDMILEAEPCSEAAMNSSLGGQIINVTEAVMMSRSLNRNQKASTSGVNTTADATPSSGHNSSLPHVMSSHSPLELMTTDTPENVTLELNGTALNETLLDDGNRTNDGSRDKVDRQHGIDRPVLPALRNMDEVLQSAAHQRRDFIMRCEWNHGQCQDDDLEVTLTDFGQCYTFNSGSSPHHPHSSDKQGSEYGLKLILNIEQYEHMQGQDADAGVKVHMQNQSDLATVRDLGSAVALSTHSQIALRYVQSVSLGGNYGDCGDSPLNFFQNVSYSRARCNQECETRELYKACNCTMYYMPSGEFEFRQCTVHEYFNCVLPWFDSGSQYICNCTDACDTVGFELEPSYASLSSIGVSGILDQTDPDLVDKYQRIVELRGRMYPETFQATVNSLTVAIQDLDALIKFAKEVSELGPTSTYKLIMESINMFAELVNRDMDSVFGDVPKYIDVYQDAFNWNHITIKRHAERAWHNLIIFVQTLKTLSNPDYETTESDRYSLRNALVLVLNDLGLLETASNFPITEPSSYLNLDDLDNYIPTDIIGDSQLRMVCELSLPFAINITSDVYNNLDTGDMQLLLNISDLVPYNELFIKLESFISILEECTSHYSGLLDDMTGGILASPMSTEVEAGANFIFEKEAEPLIEDAAWLKDTILESYLQNTYKKLDVAQFLNIERLGEITAHVETIISTINTLFTTEIRSALQDRQVDYRVKYLEGLDLLVRLQGYYVQRSTYFRDLARNMTIWLKPASYLNGVDLVKTILPENEIWRSWPEYMDLSSFNSFQARNVIEEVDSVLFDVLLGALSSVESQLIHYGNSIDASLTALREDLNTYEEEIKLDGNYILNNFLILDIYYGELTYELIQQSPSYTLGSFFGDLGGYLGLLVGASVITICEFLDLLLYNTVVKCTKTKKKTPKSRSNGHRAPERVESRHDNLAYTGSFHDLNKRENGLSSVFTQDPMVYSSPILGDDHNPYTNSDVYVVDKNGYTGKDNTRL